MELASTNEIHWPPGQCDIATRATARCLVSGRALVEPGSGEARGSGRYVKYAAMESAVYSQLG